MVFAILVFTIYRFKKSSQLFQIFCKYLHNSATKHLICRAQDLNFFQLKNSRTFGYVSLSEKRAKNALLARGLQHDVQISRFIF
jgi:hypothetical protein